MMVWGVISAHGPGSLIRLQGRINAKKYVDMLAEHFSLYFRENFYDKPILMQDNAPIHTANIVKKFLQRHEIECLDWPARVARPQSY